MKKKMFIIIGLLVLVISVLLLISYIGNKKKISNIETLNDAMEQNNIKETNLHLEKLKELKQGFIFNPDFYTDKIHTFEDLNNYPLILQKEASNSRKLLDSIALQHSVKLIPKLEVVSQELITEFTNIGLGIGFAIIDLAKINFKNLKELNINKKIPNINIYLATNKSVSLTFASKMFIKYLKK